MLLLRRCTQRSELNIGVGLKGLKDALRKNNMVAPENSPSQNRNSFPTIIFQGRLLLVLACVVWNYQRYSPGIHVFPSICTVEDDFPFPKVGKISFRVGNPAVDDILV